MKVDFLNEPHLVPVGNSGEWQLTEDFHVRIDSEDGKGPLEVTVPEGFATDIDSIPRLPLAYMLFKGRARRSAILHDYLYTMRHPRAWADAVFREAMRNEEVGMFARFFMWLGVRIGGAGHYSGSDDPGDPGGALSDTYPPQ